MELDLVKVGYLTIYLLRGMCVLILSDLQISVWKQHLHMNMGTY